MAMWLSGLSSLWLWTVVVLTGAGLTLAALWLVRHTVLYATRKPPNDVIGFVHGIVGVIYAVLLGFTIVVSWEQFAMSEKNVQGEVAIIGDLYNDNKLLSAAFREEQQTSATQRTPTGDALNLMQWSLNNYVKAVVEDEWHAMAEGRDSDWAKASYGWIWQAYGRYAQFATSTPLQGIFFSESLRKLNELGERRRTRLDDAHRALPPRFWMVLVLGGVLIIAFSLLYDVASIRVHAMIAASLAALICLSLALIVSLEHPFRGGTALSSKPFMDLLDVDPWGVK